MRLEINVYDENDTIIKTCEAHTIDLRVRNNPFSYEALECR